MKRWYAGGLFILVTSHPHELNLDRYPLYRYVGERDGVKVELLYGADNPQFDPLTEQFHRRS